MVKGSWDEKMPWCCGIAGQLECTEKLSCTLRLQGGPTELLFSSLLFIQHAIFMIRNCPLTILSYLIATVLC